MALIARIRLLGLFSSFLHSYYIPTLSSDSRIVNYRIESKNEAFSAGTKKGCLIMKESNLNMNNERLKF